MWMLVIILLNTVPDISPETLLQTYSTSQECHSSERGSVMRWQKRIPMNMTLKLPVGSIQGSNPSLNQMRGRDG